LLDRLVRHHDGLSIKPAYCGEVLSNTRGGLSTNDATRYQALFDLAVELDFEEMRSDLPGKFFLLAQNTHGRGITDDFLGDAQVVSNIDSGGNIMRVSEYWWEFGLLDEVIKVRFGKQDVNTEFLFLDSAEDFVHSSFGLTPALTLPTYPDPSMGAVVLAQLTDSWQLKLGAWNALSFGGGWGISGETLFMVAELEHNYAVFDGTLPGTLALGAGYLSDGEVLGMPLDASSGVLVQIEQTVWRESVCDDDVPQELAVFFSYVPRFFGARVINESIGDSYVGGIVYRGLIPHRDDDVVGAGVAWAQLFRGGTNQETVIEFFYKAQITSRISIQPELQYVASPSGIYRDALVAGLRMQISF
jgi:porin